VHHPLRPNILEIDLDAAAANARAVRGVVGPDRKIFAVVKADGYGQGAVEMGKVFLEHGADALAVADISEGIRLRTAGVSAPILVYPSSLSEAASEMVRHNLVPVLADLAWAQAYAKAATAPLDVFVKIDVGYDRFGIRAEEAANEIIRILQLPHLRLAGMCAHGHAHGADSEYVNWQLGRFTAVVDELESRGIEVPVRLLASSPLVMRYPQTYLNAVDPGRMLYGIIYPGETSPVPLQLTLRSLKTFLITVKQLMPRTDFTQYSPFSVERPMLIGVIPIGSADGLGWLHDGRVLVRGKTAPIIGKPSLESCRVDLTKIPNANVGDEVVIIGRQRNDEITLAEIAERHKLAMNLIPTTIGPRVVRVYRSKSLKPSQE